MDITILWATNYGNCFANRYVLNLIVVTISSAWVNKASVNKSLVNKLDWWRAILYNISHDHMYTRVSGETLEVHCTMVILISFTAAIQSCKAVGRVNLRYSAVYSWICWTCYVTRKWEIRLSTSYMISSLYKLYYTVTLIITHSY